MPNVASIAALPVHALPVSKEKEGASGKQDTVRPDFARLFREKAGPLPSRIGSTILSNATKPISGLDIGKTTDESSVIEIPAADQDESGPKQAAPDAPVSAEVKQPVGTPHAGLINSLLNEPGRKGGPASEIEIADTVPSAGANLLTERTGKAEDASSLPSEDSTTAGREKVPGTSRADKTKTVAPLPNPEQMVLTALLPLLPVSSAAGLAPVQSGNGVKSIAQQETPRGAQDSGGVARQLRMSEYGLPAASSAAHGSGDSEIGQAAPSDGRLEFGVSATNGNDMALNPADHSGSSGPSANAAPVAAHVDSRKLLTETGATGTPPLTFTAHVSTEAAVSGAQHVGGTSSPATSITTPAVNSPVAGTPYDRIDQGAAPVVLHSSVQHVSVGVQDPDLGWVEIQTQSAAGHVDATLITASGQTHASLAAQLPAMAQYLEQRDVRVGNLVVQHHTTAGSGAGSGGPGYGSANPGAGGHHSNPGNSGGDRTPPRYGGPAPGNLSSITAINAGGRPGEEAAALRAVSYISVRA